MGLIYKAINLINKKIYIGQTKTSIQNRFFTGRWAHVNQSTQQSSNYFHNAIFKYGIDNFKIEIIEECDNCNLDEREIHWIVYYDSANHEKGYNQILGGQKKFKRKPMTEEHKQKLRDYHAKPENKLKHSLATKRSLTKEALQKLSNSHKGKTYNRGRKHTEQSKRNMSIGTLKTMTPELKKKISDSTKKAMARPEVREKYLKGIERRELNRYKNKETIDE